MFLEVHIQVNVDMPSSTLPACGALKALPVGRKLWRIQDDLVGGIPGCEQQSHRLSPIQHTRQDGQWAMPPAAAAAAAAAAQAQATHQIPLPAISQGLLHEVRHICLLKAAYVF
jgi:hypothetical protein